MTNGKGLKHGLRVRVVKPTRKHAHTKGWEGIMGNPIRKGFWWVKFSGGSARYHEDELEAI